MASVTSIGIGSGLKVDDIITGLMKIESRPVTQLESRAADINAKISAYGSLTSAMEDFRSASVTLAGLGTFNSMNGSSTNANAVAVSTATGASAGSYAVEVQQLATAQSVSSKSYTAATSPVGSGTLNIDIGSWNAGNTSFTPNSGGKTLSVEVTAADTLSTLRDKINGLGAGVNASILNDASGARLVINSRETGTTNGFRITATDGDGTNTDNLGLSALAFDPPNATSATTLRQSGGDAQAKVNGLPVTSASNTLANVVEGVTLTLGATTTSPVSVAVSPDTEKVKKALTDFTKAYNTLTTLLSKQTKYDDATKTAGMLQGDSTAVSLQRQLRNLVGASSPASSMYQTLSSVGVSLQADGTLSVDDAKFSKALTANLGEVRKLFTATDLTNNSRSGIGTQLRKFSDSVLSVEGSLTSRTEALNKSLTRNETETKKAQDRVDDVEKRLRAQYSALDTKMSNLNSLNTYISNQIAAWNKA